MKFYRAIPVWFGVFIAVFALVANADVNDVNEPEKDIAVTVNGIDITEADLEKLMNPYCQLRCPPRFLNRQNKNSNSRCLNKRLKKRFWNKKLSKRA